MPCAFHAKRPVPFDDLDPGCQFNVAEKELGNFKDKSWCEFHLSMEGEDAEKMRKTEWYEAKVKRFNQRIFKHIEDAKKDGIPCDLSGVTFPGEIYFEEVEKFPKILFFIAKFYELASFANTQFYELALFDSFQILKEVCFDNAQFYEGVSCASTQFYGLASFDHAQFHKEASFYHARFYKWAKFDHAHFQEEGSFDNAHFHEGVRFDEAHFHKKVSFDHAQFEKVGRFVNVHFHKDARFLSAQFHKDARFNNAHFHEEARFDNAKFERQANFAYANFEGKARFADSQFEKLAIFADAQFRHSARFARAKFGGRANFSSRLTSPNNEENSVASFSGPVSFKKALFIRKARFNNRHFLDTTDFSKCIFRWAPSFHNSQLHQDTDFEEADFQDKKSYGAERAYRTLRLAMENVRARREEGKFYALEQQSLREQRKIMIFEAISALFNKTSWRKDKPKEILLELGTAIWDWMVSGLYEITSNYGRSSGRPLIGLVLLTVFFMALYGGLSFNSKGGEAWEEGKISVFTVQQVVRPFSAWFKTGEEFIFTNISDHVVLIQALAAVQSVFSVAFLALFLLALRWRFKRG